MVPQPKPPIGTPMNEMKTMNLRSLALEHGSGCSTVDLLQRNGINEIHMCTPLSFFQIVPNTKVSSVESLVTSIHAIRSNEPNEQWNIFDQLFESWSGKWFPFRIEFFIESNVPTMYGWNDLFQSGCVQR